jgi:hypothetical protein
MAKAQASGFALKLANNWFRNLIFGVCRPLRPAMMYFTDLGWQRDKIEGF